MPFLVDLQATAFAAGLLRLDDSMARWLHDSMLTGWLAGILAGCLAAWLLALAKATNFMRLHGAFTDFRSLGF